jgi:hypothetical protein
MRSGVTEEMGATLRRGAYSQYQDRGDFSCPFSISCALF